MCKVSVIIPVLNTVKYIRECVDSVINQTLSDLEIIIVDAGSTDGTLEILKEYADIDSRVILLQSEKKSMGFQYNIGMSRAQGEYIAFLESDDYWDLKMLENLCAIADKENVDYVKSDFDMFIDKEDRVFLNYHILSGNYRKYLNSVIFPCSIPSLMYRDVNMWNGIYRRSFIENNSIRENETPKAAFQDIGFVIQTFVLAQRAIYTDCESYKYRRDNINSSVYDINGIRFVVQEFKFIFEKLELKGKIQNNASAVVFRRFSDLYGGYYGKLPPQNDFSEELRACLLEFKKISNEWYSRIAYNNRIEEGLDTSLSINMTLNDDPLWDEFRRHIADLDRAKYRNFIDYIKRQKGIYIFGAGEFGRSCYGFLRKQNYDGTYAFVDNNDALIDKQIMGLRVRNLKIAIAEHPDAIFVLCNEAHWRDMKEQLVSMGVSFDQICRNVPIIPHLAFEMEV